MDTSVLPGDNFYNHANGTWAKNTPIPADKSNYGMFTKLDDISRERTRLIIEEQAKDPASKIGLAYNAFLDSAAIEAKGLAPFQPWLNEIKGIESKKDYAAVAAKADRIGIGSPIGVYVGQDDKNPDRYITSIGQSGLGLPDRDYYLVGRPQAGRHPRQVSRASDQGADAGGRAQCRGARQGDRRFRNQDRAGALDADRQPRRDQDL